MRWPCLIVILVCVCGPFLWGGDPFRVRIIDRHDDPLQPCWLAHDSTAGAITALRVEPDSRLRLRRIDDWNAAIDEPDLPPLESLCGFAVGAFDERHLLYARDGFLHYGFIGYGACLDVSFDRVFDPAKSYLTAALALGCGDVPAIAYINEYDLYFGTFDPPRNSWRLHAVPGAVDLHRIVGMAVDDNRKITIAYRDNQDRDLVRILTSVDGVSWLTGPSLPATASAYQTASFALDQQGTPTVLWYDLSTGQLRLAALVAGQWLTSVVDDGGTAAVKEVRPALGYDGQGGAGAVYVRQPNSLIYAYRPELGVSWQKTVVTAIEQPDVSQVALSYDPNAAPAILFARGDRLLLARRNAALLCGLRDFNNDQTVSLADWGWFLSDWLTHTPAAVTDLDHDRFVGATDLSLFCQCWLAEKD